MITARLFGRLGNQMFQFAAAHALARRVGTQAALDPREVLARGEGVLTDVFDLPVVAPGHLPPPRGARLRYLAWRRLGLAPRFRRERGLGYNPAFETWGDGSYLHGYWQSERYFAEVAGEIRAAFRFPEPSAPEVAEMAARITAGPAVSLHVRRGDYVALAAHTLCDPAYYAAALERLLPTLDTPPTVYVFSDDPAWARENLPLPVDRVVVDFGGRVPDFEDMRLMALCDHHIIANSSFSWWGAWLNPSATKQVFAPARWFGNPKLSNPDILPPGWTRVAP